MPETNINNNLKILKMLINIFSKRDNIIFILKYFLLCFIVYLILRLLLTDIFITTVSYHSAILLDLMYLNNTTWYNQYIILPNIALEVIAPCVGIEFMSIYMALVILLSKSYKQLIMGLLLTIFIYFGNIIRIVLLGVFGNYFIDYFDIFHEIMGCIILPPITIALSLYFLKFINLDCDKNEC